MFVHLRGAGVVHGVDDGAQRVPRQLRAQQDVVDDVEEHLLHRLVCLSASTQLPSADAAAGMLQEL
jgi:hypothetical protein